MIVNGTYYKTIKKNILTGETVFEIVSKDATSIDGIMQCIGKIGVFTKNMPIQLDGDFENGTFKSSSSMIPTNTKENVHKLLAWIDESIPNKKKDVIAQATNNDLLGFIRDKNPKTKILKYLIPKNFMEDYKNGTLKPETYRNYKKNAELVDQIYKKTKNLIDKEDLVKELLGYGVDIGKIDLFCRQGIDMDKIRKNPYKLLLKFDIPISVAEAIFYQNKNVSEYDIKRLTGFVYDTMKSTKENGSTCCEFWNLLYQINQRFSIFSSSNAEEAKMSASMLNLCIMEMQDIFSYQLIDDKLYIYFNEILKEEKEIVKNVKRLQSNTRQFSTDKTISQIEEKYGITYNTEQREAFDIVKTSGIKILTGPPGSGKTAVIKGLVDYFSNNGKVKLTATTGMASKVMADASQRQTQTVNQALNLSYFEESSYSKGLNDPIDADFIIVDEVSMLGTKLCSLLLPAVKNGSILLLVGDEDQLQSVEYGNVLHDLINCGKIDVYRLKEILRQSGTICDNAQKINQGNTDLKKDDSFAVYNYDNTTHAVRDLLNIKEDGSSVILTPSKLYKNNGTRFLNSKLQDDSKDILVSYGDIDFRCNDRVVMTKNNYERNYINGDLGQIVNYDNGIMTIKFADKIVDILQCDMADVDLAYALTIHKSQGSEFDNVYIILQDETKSMTTRRLLYTAITRAKKKVVIFNVNKAMETAIANRNENVRVSNLQKFLQKME